MSPKKKKLRIGKELMDLIRACWEFSPKFTIVGLLFITISVYDQIRIFPRGYGSFYKLWSLIKAIWNYL